MEKCLSSHRRPRRPTTLVATAVFTTASSFGSDESTCHAGFPLMLASTSSST